MIPTGTQNNASDIHKKAKPQDKPINAKAIPDKILIIIPTRLPSPRKILAVKNPIVATAENNCAKIQYSQFGIPKPKKALLLYPVQTCFSKIIALPIFSVGPVIVNINPTT
jgi:hypothetical protein